MRRLVALLGFVLVLALAATLLWRVWVHHNETLPLTGDDDTAVVALDVRQPAFVKIADVLS